MSDRSLDEFATAADESADESPVDPAPATMRWSPEGAPCAACGSTVSRRWRSAADAFVCADCKEW
ncbi:hypothetical protein ACFR97_07885 [Haloplanus litoreus]|uniref:DUF7573 domain-containing protein n=1 Tax=Haloplanus litoreus TaxID=767515 RepID=A0ABD6A2N2_9EURY